ncbi:hypothetical protein MRB53_021723 [Persea americana]|uniref:Uncharacterized protein n=1 Tax=Persea americana TaxID=3435 RepID=A0ACC2L5F9_PERAE|nr:hypothetical protein MRB53_021723 [Persea americana]
MSRVVSSQARDHNITYKANQTTKIEALKNNCSVIVKIQQLTENMSFGDGYDLSSSKDHSIGRSVLVLNHVCIVGRAFRRSLMAANRGERSSDSSIGMSANDLENFKMVDKCKLLPNFNHSFHVHCIDSWLLKTPFCFLCVNDESF